MKRIVIVAALAAVALAYGDTMKEYKKYAESRRYCVSRVVEGDKVITTWYRNGKPDWILPAVETNALRVITGAQQNNPIQNALIVALNDWTNATARVERATAALEEKKAEYVKKRDEATLPTTKAIYQAFIDAIDRIKKKLDEGSKE